MTRVAVYCRVSTDKEDQANSFAAQQRYFEECIRSRTDWVLFGIYADEGITGTSTRRRTQFNQMISDAYSGKIDLILTKEVSRFSRNILDTIQYTRELKKLGVAVEFVTDRINTMRPDAELYLSIMASMAQEESRKTSTRVIWGQTRQMERGVVFGHSLLGYDVKDGILTVEPHGAEIVRLIFQKYVTEQWGTTEIARYLTQKGYRTQRGSENWRANSVVKILKNEKYAGNLIQKKTYTPDYLTHEKKRNRGEVPYIRIDQHHEPIIRPELWHQAQKRLQQNNRHQSTSTERSSRHLFSGKIKCGLCGANFVARNRKNRDGSCTRSWCCGTVAKYGASSCNVGRLVRDDDALEMVRTALKYISADLEPVIKNVADTIMEENERGGDQPESLLQAIKRLQEKTDAVMDSYYSGDITKEEMNRLKMRYNQEEIQIRNQMESMKSHKDTANMYTALKEEANEVLTGELLSKSFYRSILDRIIVQPDGHTWLYFKALPKEFCFNLQNS